MIKDRKEKLISDLEIATKLELSKSEKEQAFSDLQSMVEFIEKIDEIDVADVEPLTYIVNDNNVFREDILTQDIVKESDEQKSSLKNNCYYVPKVI